MGGGVLLPPGPNKHSEPCHGEWQDVETRWKRNEVIEELTMHKRPITANRHRCACTHHPDEDECARKYGCKHTGKGTFTTSLRGSFIPAGAQDTPSPANYHPSAPSSRSSGPRSRVARLNADVLVHNQGSNLLHVDLAMRWSRDLQRELQVLAYTAPHLQTLCISISEPDDAKWDSQHVLDLATCSAPRFPALTQLMVHAVPIPEQHYSGFALPRLRHLKVTNTGHMFTRPPHHCLTINCFEHLEALEVVDMAVRMPVELGVLAACSARLRVMHIKELWGVGPEQPRHHRLVLPACRVLVIQDSLTTMSLDLWAPAVRQLQLRVPHLTNLNLGPGGANHRTKNDSSQGAPVLPKAVVTLLPGVLPEEVIDGLMRHTQVKGIEYDEAALQAVTEMSLQVQSELVSLQAEGREQKSPQPQDEEKQLGEEQPTAENSMSSDAPEQGRPEAKLDKEAQSSDLPPCQVEPSMLDLSSVQDDYSSDSCSDN